MTGVSTYGQTIDQSNRLIDLQKRLGRFQTQLTTGKKSQDFKGLGNQAISSLQARAEIRSIETFQNNITNADRRMEQMLSTLGTAQNQIRDVRNALNTQMQEGEFEDIEVVQDLANKTFDFLKDLINERDGDRYLFSGADTQAKPLQDNGLFETYLGEFVPDENNVSNPPQSASGILGQWGDGTITTDQFIAQYRNTPETTIGYSASLANDTANNVFVRVSESTELDYTVKADTQGLKDALIGVGVLKELPRPENAPGALNDPAATNLEEDTVPFPPEEKQENFFEVVRDLRDLLTRALDDIDQERFKLEETRANMKQIGERHTLDLEIQRDIVGEVEDVDVTEVATKLNFLQIQLEASFRVTSTTSRLSLSNFL